MVEFGDSTMDISRLYEVTLIIPDAEEGDSRKTLALPAHINPDEFSMLIAAAFSAPGDLGITAVQDEMTDVVYPVLALLENPSSFCGSTKAYKLLMTSTFFRDRKAKKGTLAVCVCCASSVAVSVWVRVSLVGRAFAEPGREPDNNGVCARVR